LSSALLFLAEGLAGVKADTFHIPTVFVLLSSDDKVPKYP
jgi:hypothetical protein